MSKTQSLLIFETKINPGLGKRKFIASLKKLKNVTIHKTNTRKKTQAIRVSRGKFPDVERWNFLFFGDKLDYFDHQENLKSKILKEFEKNLSSSEFRATEGSMPKRLTNKVKKQIIDMFVYKVEVLKETTWSELDEYGERMFGDMMLDSYMQVREN